MTSQDIETFIIKRIRDLSLKRQAGVTLYGYITGVFYSAVMDRKIAKDDNPCDYVDRKKFMKFYNKSKKTSEERVLSQEELASLVDKLNSEVRDDPQKLMPYGVRFSLLTGMRRGEICGLRWRNVFQDRMLICEAEKYNQKEGKYYLSDTKTGKERSLPITSELENFLNEMRKLQAQYGITDDFVISTGTGKLRTNSLSNYMLRLSHKLNFSVTKNIHTIRRTFNSYMRQSGTNAIMAGSIIGNSAEVNDNHYTYDICDMTTKNQLVTDIEKKMLTNCSFGSSIRMPLTTEELCYNRYSNCNTEPVGKQEKRRGFI